MKISKHFTSLLCKQLSLTLHKDERSRIAPKSTFANWKNLVHRKLRNDSILNGSKFDCCKHFYQIYFVVSVIELEKKHLTEWTVNSA